MPKFKNFVLHKTPSRKWKDKTKFHRMGENVYISHIFDRLASRLKLLQLNSKKNSIKKWATDVYKHLSIEDIK